VRASLGTLRSSTEEICVDIRVATPQRPSSRQASPDIPTPTSYNIEWHDVLSLLEATGTVEQEHDGKYLVRHGEEVEVITKPKHKDIDVQQVVDLRRIFTAAGYGTVVQDMEAKGKED
jgi:hypothetical protein